MLLSMEMLPVNEKKVVGSKQVLRAVKAGQLKRVYLAQDIDTFLFQRVLTAAEAAKVPVERVETSRELGEMCGVGVATASAGLLR